MTDDEVELIYNYLHANYEYRDGELIRKIKCRTQPIGKKLGCFSYTERRKPKTYVKLNFSGNMFSVQLPHLVWLYHNKKYPFCVHYKDGNPLNYKIENLFEGFPYTIKKHKTVKNPFKIENGNYKAFIRFNYKTYHLGVYVKEDDARKAYEIAKFSLIGNISLTPKELTSIIMDEIGDKTTFSQRMDKIKGYVKKGNRYYSCVSVNGKKITVGTFDTTEEARAAYLKAKEEYK